MLKKFNFNTRYRILAVFLLFLVFAAPVFAQSLSLTSSKTAYKIGDSFLVSLSINTGGKSINTVSGRVSIPTSRFQITELRYGNSIISLWVERPKLDVSSGLITFTGGIPGGFSGTSGPILSFVLKVKTEGEGTLGLSEVEVLLNDGQGTRLTDLKLNSLKLSVAAAPPPAPKPASQPETPPTEEKPAEEIYIPPQDSTPPESFMPLISSHPDIADGKYFVSFFAVDKDSGISRYEVKEAPSLLPLWREKWVKTESPYVLKHQLWRNEVMVRAYDQAGNFVELKKMMLIR